HEDYRDDLDRPQHGLFVIRAVQAAAVRRLEEADRIRRRAVGPGVRRRRLPLGVEQLQKADPERLGERLNRVDIRKAEPALPAADGLIRDVQLLGQRLLRHILLLPLRRDKRAEFFSIHKPTPPALYSSRRPAGLQPIARRFPPFRTLRIVYRRKIPCRTRCTGEFHLYSVARRMRSYGVSDWIEQSAPR